MMVFRGSKKWQDRMVLDKDEARELLMIGRKEYDVCSTVRQLYYMTSQSRSVAPHRGLAFVCQPSQRTRDNLYGMVMR